jgi:hypothetical protein|tara:strand:- start:424 stop:624 length:201 start_codon:yes stop_codon:yes gene_type:complete
MLTTEMKPEGIEVSHNGQHIALITYYADTREWHIDMPELNGQQVPYRSLEAAEYRVLAEYLNGITL